MQKSYDPSTYKELGEVPVASQEEITEKVALAHKAAKEWSALGSEERLAFIEKAWSAAEPHIPELARLMAMEMGKDIRRAGGETSGTVHGGPHIAREAKEALEPHHAVDGTTIEYRPLGVAAVISPWNYPLAMANNLIVPALMAGNTVVFKPSEETPLVADSFVEILNRVLPPNVLQIIHGSGEQGKLLVESPVNLIAFTGSQAAGKDIMARASKDLKRLIMELGGNDPMIVLKDANLNAAARFAVASSFENAGQMCISTERIYVDETIAEPFEALVTKIASQYTTGPWDMPGVNIGPMINQTQHERVVTHIKDAESKGATILLGGSDQVPPFIKPTVLTGVTQDMIMEKEETFGPVVAISRYKTMDEAIKRANDSSYGLGAVVFGQAAAKEVASLMETGMVGINQGVGGGSNAPWVGAKQSGFGYHGSLDGHRQFAQVRVTSG